MTSEHTETGKRVTQRQPSKAKRPKKTAEEKELEAAAKAEQQRQAKEERERLRLEKLEQQRQAKQEKARAAAVEKERKRVEKLEQQRRAKEEKERAVAAEKERLAARAVDEALFVEALKKARSEDNQLVDLKEIVQNVPPALKAAFTTHWREALERGALPSGVSSLRVKAGKSSLRKVLLLADLSPGAPSSSAASSQSAERAAAGSSSASLKERLLAAFDRLNEVNGKRFYVTLADLRKALPEVRREDFDAALNDLRRDWVLTLNAAEGLHETIPAHVLEAGITEQSRRLVYVARRET